MSRSRETAFLALCEAHKNEGAQGVFLSHLLPPKDALAREIALGVERRLLTLDHIAKKLTDRGVLELKSKEKMLLRMGIYQHLFMNKIPDHALVFEIVELAKKYCHHRFVKFLNAALRKLVSQEWTLPSGDDPEALSLRFSYPLFLVEKLLHAYGLEKTKQVLEKLNQVPPLTIRKRFTNEIEEISRDEIEKYIDDNAYYFQSRAQALLMQKLASMSEKKPSKILDLCAAPGGKLIAVSEWFPHAKLFANDISTARIERLCENLKKYEVESEISCFDAAAYPQKEQFDLILLDAPCSNSGVLHKRPEARWRISKKALLQLTQLQWKILQHATKLLAPGGEIWYMTCSILPDENEKIVERACRDLALNASPSIKFLPIEESEGAFGVRLSL
jgi:16S rRNA (cytosine967-C5)-methyltransferase